MQHVSPPTFHSCEWRVVARELRALTRLVIGVGSILATLQLLPWIRAPPHRHSAVG